MSEAYHGKKMLLDLPADVSPPMVRVLDQSFFVGELLARANGKFFIPERFFYNTLATPEVDVSVELSALGREVTRLPVGSIHYMYSTSHAYSDVGREVFSAD